jgi:hypothetical protein
MLNTFFLRVLFLHIYTHTHTHTYTHTYTHTLTHRDVALVGGMFVMRWRSLGWRSPWTPGDPLTSSQFFRTADAAALTGAVSEEHSGKASSSGEDGAGLEMSEIGKAPKRGMAVDRQEQQRRCQPRGGPALSDPGVPYMRPLLISKANTVLQLLLVGG